MVGHGLRLDGHRLWLFSILPILVVVVLIRDWPVAGSRGNAGAARDILRTRLARGVIDGRESGRRRCEREK